MNNLINEIISWIPLILFLVIGSIVVWKIFTKLLHLAIFIFAILILVYIYKHNPTVHQFVSTIF